MITSATVQKTYSAEIPGDGVIRLADGTRWQYMSIRDWHTCRPITQRYYHLDCDAMTDQDGRCVLCCRKAPGVI
jgi:hypothetical protein